MKTRTVILSILLFLLMVAAAQAAPSVVSVTSPQDAAALVYVSGYEIDPQVFYPYESGTVTVHVTNAANTSVGVSQPDLIDPHVHILNQDAFNTMTNIGPGATVDYSFLITVDPPDDTYFPLFTVSPKAGGNAIHATLKLVVDSTPVRASISKKPDTFSLDKTDTVNVSITNPRDGDINNVLVVPEGSGTDISPAESFQPVVSAGSSVMMPFSITPHQAGNVTFHVTYRNGKNQHTSDVVLPLNLGNDKTAASPIINNIVLTTTGSSYQIAGDVTNAGITDAKSLVLTVLPPARPVEPYVNYAVGSLASDDFSSFELTFTASDLSAVPVQVSWKDASGNTFTSTTNLNLNTASNSTSGTRSGSSGSGAASGTTGGFARGGAPGGGGGIFGIGGSSRGGGLSAFYLPIELGIGVIIAVILWMKRKWILAKLKKKQ